jgi:hypothetical protein
LSSEATSDYNNENSNEKRRTSNDSMRKARRKCNYMSGMTSTSSSSSSIEAEKSMVLNCLAFFLLSGDFKTMSERT